MIDDDDGSVSQGPGDRSMIRQRGSSPRPQLRRGIVILPSAFTMANLFFGVYAIVAASRGELGWAGWFIVFGAISDNLDGRVARFTRTGSKFGEELDSLVDMVSFGIAPAYIMFTLYFSEGWGWMVPFAYSAAVAVRLARFNVEQSGGAKRYFLGLPSPTAGMILATFYPFSETPWFQTHLSGFAWPQIMAVSMVALSALMLSHVPYPLVPRIGFRSVRGVLNGVFMLLGVTAAVAMPRYWFFPALATYTVFGLARSFILGLLDRLPDRDPLDESGSDDDETEVRSLDYGDLSPRAGRREAVHNDRSEDV